MSKILKNLQQTKSKNLQSALGENNGRNVSNKNFKTT